MLLVIRFPRLTVTDQSEVIPLSDFQSNVTKWAEDIAAVFAQKERKVGSCLGENLFEYHSKILAPSMTILPVFQILSGMNFAGFKIYRGPICQE